MSKMTFGVRIVTQLIIRKIHFQVHYDWIMMFSVSFVFKMLIGGPLLNRRKNLHDMKNHWLNKEPLLYLSIMKSASSLPQLIYLLLVLSKQSCLFFLYSSSPLFL